MLQAESGTVLEGLEPADNVDLIQIIQEYEDYFELRFGKPPRLIKKSKTGMEVGASNRNGRGVGMGFSGGPLTLTAMTNQREKKKGKGGGDETTGVGPGARNSLRLPDLSSCGASASNAKNQQGGKEKRAKGCKLEPDDTTETDANLLQVSACPPVPRVAGGGGLEDSSGGAEGPQIVLKNKRERGDGTEENQNHPTNQASRSPMPPQADQQQQQGPLPFPVGAELPNDSRLLRPFPVLDVLGNDPDYRDLVPAISREIVMENPGVKWDDIVGLDRAKELLKEAVVMPHKYPKLFTGLLAPWRGVLLFGPPEKLVRVLFELARFHRPSTIFIDEMDSLMSQRGGRDAEHEGSRRMKTELLVQMDGVCRDTGRGKGGNEGVFLLAASNLPWDLDAAVLRRFEKRVSQSILADLPDERARTKMVDHFFSQSPVPVSSDDHQADTNSIQQNKHEQEKHQQQQQPRAHVSIGVGPGDSPEARKSPLTPLSLTLPQKDEEKKEEGDTTESEEPAPRASFSQRVALQCPGFSGADVRMLCKEAAMRPLRRLIAKVESASSPESLRPEDIPPELSSTFANSSNVVERAAARKGGGLGGFTSGAQERARERKGVPPRHTEARVTRNRQKEKPAPCSDDTVEGEKEEAFDIQDKEKIIPNDGKEATQSERRPKIRPRAVIRFPAPPAAFAASVSVPSSDGCTVSTQASTEVAVPSEGGEEELRSRSEDHTEVSEHLENQRREKGRKEKLAAAEVAPEVQIDARHTEEKSWVRGEGTEPSGHEAQSGVQPRLSEEKEEEKPGLGAGCVVWEDVEAALRVVRPSSTIPNKKYLKWRDAFGSQ
uniref:AAA+ ATPase domain-containing protein n=1 Tax=Chromera velia CCMP2878 TaxID=1169474 RepID=A0A0G4F6B3_9ALVE|eukprot:Cvel_2763.t1-p1 / transcript=Cvel_2763.t1 / gene=Cvel_2763 / organism=Chromera_velia_CCMP2878 / gene_product=Katanin p60 ATPase-containing subunit A-like 2, putative / transcript_product=Katanin p60 ATPase-containing subunit A-like 2, putative / location=Cvel_scaffold111:23398-30543(+) / protein_length=830 / sequence_SO=supercontig / SO=protein_coding / is_pseudo=false